MKIQAGVHLLLFSFLHPSGRVLGGGITSSSFLYCPVCIVRPIPFNLWTCTLYLLWSISLSADCKYPYCALRFLFFPLGYCINLVYEVVSGLQYFSSYFQCCMQVSTVLHWCPPSLGYCLNLESLVTSDSTVFILTFLNLRLLCMFGVQLKVLCVINLSFSISVVS